MAAFRSPDHWKYLIPDWDYTLDTSRYLMPLDIPDFLSPTTNVASSANEPSSENGTASKEVAPKEEEKINDFPGGFLDRFPVEIAAMVLMHLDIRTLTKTRRVCSKARRIIDAIPQYREIIIDGQFAIQAAFGLGCDRWFSCADLHRELYTERCWNCGNFGGYLYMITCRRVCFVCFTHEEEYRPLQRTHVLNKYGIERRKLATIPHMKAVFSLYDKRAYYDFRGVEKAASARWGSVQRMREHVAEWKRKAEHDYHSRKAQGKNPKDPNEQDWYEKDRKRFVAILRTPVWRPGDDEEWGVHCIGCKNGTQPKWHQWWKFSPEGFEDHIRGFGQLIEVVQSWNGKVVLVHASDPNIRWDGHRLTLDPPTNR